MNELSELIDTEVEIVPFEDQDATDETRSHYVNPPNNLHIYQPGMTSQEIVDIARMLSVEVRALCGYTWVPKRNPKRYPVCERCVDIAAGIVMNG
jgi:hypothetical protein